MTDAPACRRRTPADLDACVRALGAVHRQDGYPMNWPADPAGWLTPETLLAAWVAELDGRVAGHVALCGSTSADLAPGEWSRRTGRPAAATAVVGRLFVAPTARGHRLGAALLALAERDARGRGLHPVLDVLATDAAATALYRRAGWTELTAVDQDWGAATVTLRCFAAPLATDPANPVG
ncbi:GNAT family N-acetyltransferase [Streptomyces sp. TLI_171]|uniref:GNAT family N-acetyltransferase n=1 Tax=Streptomyces sp. TLI_171 TaxID=1938859 RepID=UPI000C17BE19|nr:GNAT family N-acetyltransferase [Streptomyces sp. TLI_171]RKE23108.1 acetyltransferase (GNAT) family protein [Streptomyces sp. TLI_171]